MIFDKPNMLYMIGEFVFWSCFCLYLFVCTLFTVKYEKIKFLVIALKDSIEIYAWAPKPYHKFMAFKVSVQCR